MLQLFYEQAHTPVYETYIVSVHYSTSGSASVEKLKHRWVELRICFHLLFVQLYCTCPTKAAGTSLHMHAYLVTTGHGRHASCGEMVSIELAPGSLVCVGTKGNLLTCCEEGRDRGRNRI